MGYHIIDRNDGHDDDDGKTRAWPSRTRWGAAYSLGEKFPFLLERRFGIGAFDYWWGYTSAQIDLMLMDQPTIEYDTKDNKGKKSIIATKQEEDEMKSLVEQWKKDRNGKSYVGKTFSLNDFMAGKVE